MEDPRIKPYANLRYANLRGADLSGANLRGADLTDAALRYANLRGANLTDAALSGANLTDANLTDADLRGANLSGANLTDAALSGANLTDASLRYANLRGADLSGANLRGAALDGTLGNMREIKSAQIAHYPVIWFVEDNQQIVQIGCQRHPLSYWEQVIPDSLCEFDPMAPKVWERVGPTLLELVRLCPAVPTNHKEKKS
jgi:hypothetical protein